jgi:class 3 adenylate cyclase
VKLESIGSGPIAYFDGPARAIRCALAILGAAGEAGVSLAVGLHTGECDLVDGKITGVAVGIASRVASTAEPGEVLVSSTVRDLVAGAGLNFREPEAADFEGLGTWMLARVIQ